jgi:hypothetical protein
VTGRCEKSILGKLLHRLSRQGSANVSKCQQVSANVSIHVDFVFEKSFLSATVSNCPQLSANVSRFVFLSASVSMMTPAYPI